MLRWRKLLVPMIVVVVALTLAPSILARPSLRSSPYASSLTADVMPRPIPANCRQDACDRNGNCFSAPGRNTICFKAHGEACRTIQCQ